MNGSGVCTQHRRFNMSACMHVPRSIGDPSKPATAQLVETLSVNCCSNKMVPGSGPDDRILCQCDMQSILNTRAMKKKERLKESDM